MSPLSPHTPPHPNASTSGTTVATNALPGFYCENKGHNPGYIPFTLVNDGICDYSVCCDGSDEYAHAGGVSCPDRCKEMGKEWRKAEEVKRKSRAAAVQRRQDLIKAAEAKRKDIETEIANLAVEIATAEAAVKKAETEKKEIETKEANRVVKSGGKGKAGVLAGLTKDRLIELRVQLTRVKAQRDAYVARTGELEALLTTFKEEYNPNFNDEGVKRAVRAWEEYAAADQSEKFEENTPAERDLADILTGPDSDGIDWEEFETEEEEVLDDVAAREFLCQPWHISLRAPTSS